MSAKRRNDTDEFKPEAIRLVTAPGDGVSETARNLGRNATRLGRWTRAFETETTRGVSRERAAAARPGGMIQVTRRTSATSLATRHVKNSPGLLCQRVERRYACMAEHQGTWPVSGRGEVLEVSRRGFDAYLPRQATTEVDAEAGTFGARVQAIAADTRASDGRRRMARQLQAEGLAVAAPRRGG